MNSCQVYLIVLASYTSFVRSFKVRIRKARSRKRGCRAHVQERQTRFGGRQVETDDTSQFCDKSYPLSRKTISSHNLPFSATGFWRKWATTNWGFTRVASSTGSGMVAKLSRDNLETSRHMRCAKIDYIEVFFYINRETRRHYRWKKICTSTFYENV